MNGRSRNVEDCVKVKDGMNVEVETRLLKRKSGRCLLVYGGRAKGL
jgi:hypothetical protein